MSYNIAILASTNGTDLQAIIDEKEKKNLNVEIIGVFSNKKECYAIERAKNHNIPTFIFSAKGKTREEFDREMSIELDNQKTNLIVCVGYMRLFSPWFVGKYNEKIINIHPSLLPKYPGMDLDVHTEILKNNEKESGMTIHFIDEGMDTGEIILQKKCKIDSNETPESLKDKVQELEKEWYPKVIQMFRKGKI